MRGFFKRLIPAALCALLILYASGAFAYTTLERGSTGGEVIRLQQALTLLGYGVGADGVFGTQTRNAVKAFQADQNLTVDGKAGNKTLTLLYALAEQKQNGTVTATASPAQPAPSASGQQARVYCSNGGKLNLRAGAGTGYRSLTQIPTGDYVLVLSQGSKWSSVSYNGVTGYVMTSFLRMDGGSSVIATAGPAVTAAPATAAPVTSASQQAVVACADGGKLNLRQTAASGARILERIPNGTRLTVYPAGGKWYNTAYNGQSGYVMGSFLDFNVSGAAPATASPVATAAPLVDGAVTAVVSCSGSLNLRGSASTGGSVLARIPDGTTLAVKAAGSGWYATVYNGQSGYVMAKFLLIGGTPAATAAPSQPVNSLQYEEFRRATVSAPSGSLNVRKGPGETYGRVGELRTGTEIMISSIEGDWCAMYYGDIQGYVSKQYLSIQAGGGSAPTSPVAAVGSYATYVVDYNGNTSSAKTTAVRNAQNKLRDLGYNVPLTGAFEARTHDAIVAFQLRNGLTATGKLDSATQSALYSGNARDAASPSRYYLPSGAGTGISRPSAVELLHWSSEVSGLLSGQQSVTVYDPATGLSWTLRILSRGRHLDVEPASLTDTLIQKKSFGATSWDVHPVYVRMPDGRWSMATMHNYPHGTSTINDNGFGGQNCVHFLRDMAEAQKNDPSYGVRNQEVLRQAWYSLTGITVN